MDLLAQRSALFPAAVNQDAEIAKLPGDFVCRGGQPSTYADFVGFPVVLPVLTVEQIAKPIFSAAHKRNTAGENAILLLRHRVAMFIPTIEVANDIYSAN